MTKTNYEQRKRECWGEYCKQYGHTYGRIAFDFAFDRAYALGKQEEMLICEKSKVQRAYNTSREIVKAENPDSLMYSMHTQIMCVLENIFGSKCLPDANEDNFVSIEPKPADCNRLHIATRVMCAMLSNTADNNMEGESMETCITWAYEIADELIRQSGKGESK